MGNLYSLKTPQAEVRTAFGVDAASDHAGNSPALPGIFPEQPMLVALPTEGERLLEMFG